MIENPITGANAIHALVTWPVLVLREYIDRVAERKGEALVILAHYAALVDTHRDMWLVCDGGKYLVDSISQHLGPRWDEWLQWPRQLLIETDHVQDQRQIDVMLAHKKRGTDQVGELGEFASDYPSGWAHVF